MRAYITRVSPIVKTLMDFKPRIAVFKATSEYVTVANALGLISLRLRDIGSLKPKSRAVVIQQFAKDLLVYILKI